MPDAIPLPHVDDATAFIVESIRAPQDSGYSTYGYDFYLPNTITDYIVVVEKTTEHRTHVWNGPRATALSPIFYEACWDLCRRGVLRPGIARLGGQATSDGSSGNGYSVTSQGRKWLSELAGRPFIGDTSRLGELFAKLSVLFGDAFRQRAIEAAQCHKFGSYLASCAMCGAAAESILLTVAIAKKKDEAATLALYRSSNGRKKVTDEVVGKARPAIAEPFRSATGLLSFWRDEAAHGAISNISEIEAHEAVARLLRFAQFASDNWAELTAQTP